MAVIIYFLNYRLIVSKCCILSVLVLIELKVNVESKGIGPSANYVE